MRQSGVIAAAALYALEHHLARLAEDHARAAAFAKRVDGVAGARVVPPDTNIVMLDLPAGTRHRGGRRRREEGRGAAQYLDRDADPDRLPPRRHRTPT